MAVVLVAVITGLRPHLVAGAAQAAPVPGPPAVGDCVLDPLPDPALVRSAGVTATSGGTVPVYPALQIRPCTGIRYGEVTSLIAAPRPAVVKGDTADSRYLEDPNLDSCYPAATRYVGTSAQPILDGWQTYLQITAAISRPSARQEAAGQRWAACTVALIPDATRGPSISPQYSTSIYGALHTGRLRNQLGNCVPTILDWSIARGSGIGDCGRPHSMEILALGWSGDHPLPRAQLELTCQQLVRQLTAMPDPTAAGGLSVQVYVEDNNSTTVTTAQVPADSSLACGVTTSGTRKLGGSLLALGRQPIPWA